ncbi:CHASE2 domain-containing protein [Ramlibacter rhizophilus]|uniref:CHASE2 domain-containing protein n=1 Tax=Ramlibacter rhizophilus TaxID=1781167 RepID=A0A4Z0C4H4_9BURK|nr:CHASE2 domain-containing protein [Ramlibacter rhizophilus]TFZ05029.1 CHASE2 domain-containing protein [Ramlibacter rhizophilus]
MAGIVQSALVAGVIGLAGWFSLFQSIDGRIADQGVRLSPVQADGQRQVLLVEAPVEAFVSPETDWPALAARLLALGAKRVAFTALPTLEPNRLAALLSNPLIDAAAAVDVDPANPDRKILRVPPALASIDIGSVTHLGPSGLGVHRHVPGPVAVASSELPSLELVVAQHAGRQVPSGELFVDFSTGPPERLPRATLEQVRTGKLIPEAVRGRVALVGPVSNRFEASVVTPLTTRQVAVSELEFHAYALDTLLRGTAGRTIPAFAELALVALGWLAAVGIAIYLPFRKAWITATLLGLGILVLKVALVPLAHFHLPVVAMLLTIAVTTVAVLHDKSRREARQLRSLLTTTSVALANRWAADAPMDDKVFWSHLLAMVDQWLPLTRAVLLIRDEGKDQLRLQGTLRCVPEQIADRRRDLRRPPYEAARSSGTPHPTPSFLLGGEADEQVLMLPLRASEQLLGFWVFGVDADRLSLRPTLADAFRRVADEMAESVREHRAHQDPATGFKPAGTDRELQRLSDNLHAIDRHFRLSEHIFMGLRTPTVVFDLFGRTIAVNARMKEVFTRCTDPSLVNAPHLLEVLCQLPPAGAREALAAVMFEGHEFEHTARCDEDRYILRATALRDAPAVRGPQDAGAVLGLQLELLPLARPDAPAHSEHVHVWDALERALGRVASLPQFDSLEFEMDGPRDLPPLAARPHAFTEAVAAVMQLLAEDATLPGTISVCVNEVQAEGRSEVVIQLAARGFGVPAEALSAALDGPQTPASGPLRKIRSLRQAAFRAGSFELHSELGQGYRVRIAMPAAL